MPYLKPITAKLRAAQFTKAYIESGCNQTLLAKKEGVTSQAINQRFKKLPTQTPLQEALEKVGITTVYKAKKFKELLEAKKLHGERGIKTEDNTTRSATLRLICQVSKDIDSDKDSNSIKIVNIVHAYKKEENARNP